MKHNNQKLTKEQMICLNTKMETLMKNKIKLKAVQREQIKNKKA